MKTRILNFWYDRSGALTVEVAIVLAAIVVMLIAAMMVIAPGIDSAGDYNRDLLDFEVEGNVRPGLARPAGLPSGS